jgi:flagellar hook-basal body complex protein FliE
MQALGKPMNPIQNIHPAMSLQGVSLEKLAAAEGDTQGTFKNLMLDSIDQVNDMQFAANRAVEQLSTGGDVNTAEVFTAIQKADMSFRMMMQIRNKMVDAYQEIQNIRI